jgi:hypothetical protein
MRLLVLIPALFLVACDMVAPAAPDLPGPDACFANGGAGLVGQPESVLAAMTFPAGTRIYRTGDPLTMDYSPGRLNIEIGPDGVIVAVSCG